MINPRNWSSTALRRPLLRSPNCYRSLPFALTRASSLSAIHRGLRQSERAQYGDQRDSAPLLGRRSGSDKDRPRLRASHTRGRRDEFADQFKTRLGTGVASVRQQQKLRKKLSKKQAEKEEDDDEESGRRTRRKRFTDTENSFGKRSLVYRLKYGDLKEKAGQLQLQEFVKPEPFRSTKRDGHAGTGEEEKPTRESSGRNREAPGMNRERFERNPEVFGRNREAIGRSHENGRSREASGMSRERFERNPEVFGRNREAIARGHENGRSREASGMSREAPGMNRERFGRNREAVGSREIGGSREAPGMNRERFGRSREALEKNDKGWKDEDSHERPIASHGRKKEMMPMTLKYTTAASQFLYGRSVVKAALEQSRRKLYNLYIYGGENRKDSKDNTIMTRLASKHRVPITIVPNHEQRIMDKMSMGRPHNGFVLEASPLPRLPITSLGNLDETPSGPGFHVKLDFQTKEEEAVNGNGTFVRRASEVTPRPFVLLVNEILDPGNLGGIIRTASYLGIDAVGITNRGSSTLTPVVLKSAAGAVEEITLFTVDDPVRFLEESRKSGWKTYAAVAPPDRKLVRKHGEKFISTDELEAQNPLSEDPCILVLGNEGHGLSKDLKVAADYELSVPRFIQGSCVDSLNVSVAAGLLCHSFVKQQVAQPSSLAEAKEAEEAEEAEEPEEAKEAREAEKAEDDDSKTETIF